MNRVPIVGIDLGTTNTLVAYVADGRPRIIAGPGGRLLLPSVVSYTEDGKVLVGDEARELGHLHPERTVHSVKRLVGRKLEEVAGVVDRLPYSVEDAGGRLAVRIGERRLSPEEISAAVLTAARERAEAHFAGPVRDAVITVPAYFDDAQRQATRDAGRLAGLRVLRILNEPTAAALAYGLHEKKEGVIAVYDLGGGTFDVSILQVTDGIFRVLATHGDTLLGGDDFDAALAALARGKLGIDETAPAVRHALLREAVRVKHELSAVSEAPFAFAGRTAIIRRDEFEAVAAPLVERTLASVRRCLGDAAIGAHEVDEIVLVGGATRMPVVRERVAAMFGRAPHVEMNPDEVVALGAAVQADILAGGADLVLLDVIPLSLGLETMGGAVAKLIDRNTTVPASATQLFTTYADNQTAVDFTIVQGERELVRDNRLLGRFKLRGIPPQPAGLPKVRVTFAVDESGILTVTAVEERSGRRAHVEVVPTFNLPPDEVDRLIEDAYDNAEDDYRARMLADIRVESEIMLRAVTKGLGAPGAALSDAERAAIEETAAMLRGVMARDDFRAIKNAYDALNASSRAFAERLMDSAVYGALADRRLSDVD